ncbi:NDP-sugar synthase [Chlorobium limicola]
MKTLIAIKEADCNWMRETLPDTHPLLAPLCNKPFVEYLIDFAILAGCREIRLLSDGPLSQIEEYCSNGSRWGIELTYSNLHPSDGEQELLRKNRKFCDTGRTIILSGYNFIDYDKTLDYRSLASIDSAGAIASCPGGSITLAGPPEPSLTDQPLPPIGLTPVDDLKSYCRIAMTTLETGSSRYVLPGYGGEPGCAIGRNVTISKTAQIHKPASIGNNVRILPGAVIGPSAIIGSNVIIDKGSTVKESIILDNTYIGEQLEIEGRIASKNTLIDPESGVTLAMQDPHLLAGINGGATALVLWRKIVHALAAALLLLLLSIPFAILYPLLRLRGKWQDVPSIPNAGLAESIASAFSLDRYPLLPGVLTGRLAIIGSRTHENRAANHAGTDCRPAVFSYAETEAWAATESDAAIVERYHALHSTPLGDIGMTIQALINRIHYRNPT